MDEKASKFTSNSFTMFLFFLLLFRVTQDFLDFLSLLVDLWGFFRTETSWLTMQIVFKISWCIMPLTFLKLRRSLQRPKMRNPSPQIRFNRLINNLLLNLLELKHRCILKLINLYTTILNSPQLKQSILNHIPINSRMIEILHFLIYCIYVLELLDFLDCYYTFLAFT